MQFSLKFYHLDDLYSSTYENVILSDFNADTKEKHMKCFCDNYNLECLIKQPTCYKNHIRSTYINLLS